LVFFKAFFTARLRLLAHRFVIQVLWHFEVQILKGKCALGPFLSILVIECQHKCFCVDLCKVVDKVQIMSKGMFLRLSTLF
jgi:hypothetical protein